MKKILSVFLAGLIMVMQVVPAFSYDRTESIESTETNYDRCDDFYAQSYNNYVVENGFVFDLDTQTIVQFNASQYIESLIEGTLDGSLEEENIGQEMSSMYIVVIPETIAGKTVKFIGNYSFANVDIKQVYVPNSVEKIGDRAFEYCGLQSVCLNEGLLEIGRNAFCGTAKDTTIVVPSTVKYVDFHTNMSDNASFIFKSKDTKYNEFGYRDGHTIFKSDIVFDENATIPTLFEDTTSKSLDTYLWCHHTETNGFTYAYPISISWACSFCGENFTRVTNGKCPYCQETITEEDGTWLKDISDEDYYNLYKETHEGMELREYLIHKLVEAGLIVDEKTALVTDDEINTYLEENLVPYHFSWKDGKLVSSYYKWITGYDASLDESPEEITVTEIDARITDVNIFNNLEQLETLNLSILSLIDWAEFNSEYSYTWDGYSSLKFNSSYDEINTALLYAGVLSLANLGNFKILSNCDNLKQINITCEGDVSEYTDEELNLVKALFADYLSLAFKHCFNFDVTSVDYTFPSFIDVEIVEGAVYCNNRSVLLAALEDKETYEMPSSVTSVCTFALSKLNIDNVIWSENCSYIPFGCFAKSTIKSINFNGVKTIEDFAFYKTNISSIELPASVTTLGSCVFSGTPITEFELPETVVTVGSAIFANCLNLKSVTLNNLTEVTLNHYPFFMSQTEELGEHTVYGMMSYSYYAECGGPYDETVFGFVPNLEELYIGKNIKSVSIDSLGYLPSLTTIMIDESNEYLTTYNNFVITREDSYNNFEVLFAPQGANFTNIPTNFPLELFVAEYFKPINSIVASTSHFDLYDIDVNHLYITGVKTNDLLNAVYNIKDKNLFMGLFATVPNYLHTNKTGFIKANLENINIPETVTIVQENKEIDIDTDNGAELDVSLQNVSGKLYKIPRWTELTKNDFKYVGESDKYWKFAWYLGSEEFVSINVDLLNEYVFSHTPKSMSSGYSRYYDGVEASDYNFSDSTLKALRFVGDLDLLSKPLNEYKTLIEQLCKNLGFTNLYNLELTPNTVKSLFPDDLEMHSVIDKYTWDDGYLHFTSGGRFPVLQTDSPQQENIINDFINEFFIPWYNSTYGKVEDYNADVKSLLAISEYSFLKVADMNGIEYDLEVSSLVDDMYFDMLVQSEYELAQENLSDMLTTNNITNLEEFKQYYVDNYITFDEETQTLISISSVNGMMPTNLYFPAKINGVEVKRVSAMLPLVNMMFGSEVESMYIPSTIESIGCVTENIDNLFSDFYLKTMMSAYGFTTIEELDAFLLEDSGMEFSAVNFNVNDDADLKNGLGILCDPDNIIISSANEYFKKRTNVIGNTEIVSEDGKICYAVGKGSSNEICLSGLSTTYAPYSLGHYDESSSYTYYFDVMGIESNFENCSLSLVMAVDGYMCPDCGVILNKTRASCPLCSTTELAVMQMDMNTMECNYGATWRQEIVDGTAYTKAISNVIAYNENSSFLTHCTDEHDGKACCSYVDPSTLTGYKLTNYEMTVEAYNNPPSEESTTESKDLYNITTDSDDIVTYSDEEFFETQFFVIENQPEQYLDAGIIVVEPFQKTKTVTLALKKGTVNIQVYDVENKEYFTGSETFNIYNSADDSFVSQISLTGDTASVVLPVGSYYVVPDDIEDYKFDVSKLEVSLTEDGEIKNLCFNISYYINYGIAIPEYIYPTQTGEEIQEYEVSALEVSLPSVKTLEVSIDYSGKLTNQNGVQLDYDLVQSGTVVENGDNVLVVRKPDGKTKTANINAVINDRVLVAGIYTDTVTFTAIVN